MSAVPVIDPHPAPRRADAASGYGVTLPRVIRSEWIKLRSVRSTVVTLALTGAAVAALGALILSAGSIGPDDSAPANPVGTRTVSTRG